jgi:DNA-binding NarL/FixJ family response regulator
MGQMSSFKQKEKNNVEAKKQIFVWTDQVNKPVLMVAVSSDNLAVDLTQLAKSMLGENADMKCIDMPMDAELITEKIHHLFNDNPNSVKAKNHHKRPKSLFSNRELEILQLISLEYTNEEIADKLCLAKRTIDNHRVNLMQRANAKNTAGLMGYAFRNGLLV